MYFHQTNGCSKLSAKSAESLHMGVCNSHAVPEELTDHSTFTIVSSLVLLFTILVWRGSGMI